MTQQSGPSTASTDPTAPTAGAPQGRRPRRGPRRSGSSGSRVVQGGPRVPPSRVKQVVVGIIGSLITLLGVALLALPGPGFLLVAAGLAILSTQFRWARRPLRYATVKAQQGVDEIAKSVGRTVLAVLCALALMAPGVLDLAGVELPYVGRFLNTFTDCTLIASGLFLIGLVVYARRTGGVSPEGTEGRARAAEAQRG